MKFSIGQFGRMMELNEMKKGFWKVGFTHNYTQMAFNGYLYFDFFKLFNMVRHRGFCRE